MQIQRTPEDRFRALKDFPYSPRYVDVEDNLRMHYVDEGPREGQVVLLLHGEPTWAYLYRKMIPTLVEAGFRAVVPDLIGFGRSDKPERIDDYSYSAHMRWLRAFIERVGLDEIILFCQDWGSLLGLRLVGEEPDLFARVMVSNGFLPTARNRMPPAFTMWRAFARYSPWFPIGRIVQAGSVERLSGDEIAAYEAPFPSDVYKAGARAFPRLVPIAPDDPAIPGNREAWHALGQFEKPFLCVFGQNDPILGRADRPLIEHVPGAKGQPHARIRGGHFIQEDCGPELAKRLVAWASQDRAPQ